MLQVVPGDLFATKGIEYLLVIGFLMALIWFWKLLNSPAVALQAHAVRAAPMLSSSSWFLQPLELFYHPGHTWAQPEGGGLVRVGIDDFAQKLLGQPRSVRLPSPGERLSQGAPGWQVDVDAASIDLLSPVEGEVVAVNEAALTSPALINQDPYGAGWLIKVRPSKSKMKANMNNLLQGDTARAWMQSSEKTLRQRMSGEVGQVLQDGGIPVSGIARNLSPDQWEDVAREFLLT